MAKIEVVRYIDDLTHEVISEDEVEVVNFSVGSEHYLLETSKANAERFRDEMARYTSAAQRIGVVRPAGIARALAKLEPHRRPASPDVEQRKAMREWLKAHGWDLRTPTVPTYMVEAYNERREGPGVPTRVEPVRAAAKPAGKTGVQPAPTPVDAHLAAIMQGATSESKAAAGPPVVPVTFSNVEPASGRTEVATEG